MAISVIPIPVITIDGPGGAGKGTIGQLIALRLAWNYLDSGALYRVVGWIARQHDLDENDDQQLVSLLSSTRIESEPREGQDTRILVNDYDLSEEIRDTRVGDMASRLARLAPIRAALLDCQKQARKTPGLVADGRDMGTVVFPDATLKIYLDASAQARAQRRYKQLKDKGLDVNLARLLEEMQDRDRRDRERAESPLVAAEDAVHVDTTDLTIEQVIDEVLGLYKPLSEVE